VGFGTQVMPEDYEERTRDFAMLADQFIDLNVSSQDWRLYRISFITELLRDSLE
jgi:hypothetical protein